MFLSANTYYMHTILILHLSFQLFSLNLGLINYHCDFLLMTLSSWLGLNKILLTYLSKCKQKIRLANKYKWSEMIKLLVFNIKRSSNWQYWTLKKKHLLQLQFFLIIMGFDHLHLWYLFEKSTSLFLTIFYVLIYLVQFAFF